MKPIVWSIGGSDCSAAAGIQADLLTGEDLGVRLCTAITAATAQNSQGVQAINSVSAEVLLTQLEALQGQSPPAAIKIGMLGTAALVDAVCQHLEGGKGRFVVLDPVLQSSSGTNLLDAGGQQRLCEALLPQIDLLTPNIPEAQCLLGTTIEHPEDIEHAAKALCALGPKAVLIKGGHSGSECCNDYFHSASQSFWLNSPRINSRQTRGTGCCLGTAIAAIVAQGYRLDDALVLAKAYLNQGIRFAIGVDESDGRDLAQPVAHRGWPHQLVDLPKVYLQGATQNPVQFARCAQPLALYPVVDSVEWLQRLLALGVKTLQLRLKDQDPAQLEQSIREAVALQRARHAQLFINDYWELAIKHGAYGVHLGQQDVQHADLNAIAEAGLRLGVSTHSWWEIARAHGIAPSYIAIGPVYATTTKEMPFAPQGLEQLARWVALLQEQYPTVAIGGINVERAQQVLATGVSSIAMVSAITQATDYVQAVKQLQALVEVQRCAL